MIELNDKWINFILSQRETGMGYYVVSVILNDGRKIDHVLINEGYITLVKDYEVIPFRQEEIREIYVTNEKWNWHPVRMSTE